MYALIDYDKEMIIIASMFLAIWADDKEATSYVPFSLERKCYLFCISLL